MCTCAKAMIRNVEMLVLVLDIMFAFLFGCLSIFGSPE